MCATHDVAGIVALDNLVGAGGLGLFEDTGLQWAVSNYGRAIDRHKEIQNELVEFQLNYFIVFLRDQVLLLGKLL